jgi:hypothetical protein
MKKLLILTSIVLASCGSGGPANNVSDHKIYTGVYNGVPACRSTDLENNIKNIYSPVSDYMDAVINESELYAADMLTNLKLHAHSLDFQYYENGNIVGYARLDSSRLDVYSDALIEDTSYWAIYKNDFSKSKFSLARMSVSLAALQSELRLFEQDYRALCSSIGFKVSVVPIDG